MIEMKTMPIQILDRDWFTVAQTAAYLQVSTRTVHRYLDAGVLSASQLVAGGTVRVSVISIENLLKKQDGVTEHYRKITPTLRFPAH